MITVEMIIKETIIDVMTISVMSDMLRIAKMTTKGIIEIIMIGTTHLDEMAIIDNPTGENVIKMTEGPITIEEMMIIVHQIIDLMTTESRKGLGNFNMIPKIGIIMNLKMLVDLNMNPENLVAHQFQITTYAKRGKAPTVNMVVPEIQQVTTRSKGKQSEWEVQEVVWKEAKEWVEEANNNNVARILQDNDASSDDATTIMLPEYCKTMMHHLTVGTQNDS